VDSLKEINFGTWEGQKLTAVPRAEMAGWMQDLRGFRFPNGENFYDMDKRVGTFLDTLPDDGEFLWVTHAGVIAALQHFACGLPDSDFVEGKFSYTMVNRFELTRNAEGHYHGTFTKIHDGIQMPPLPLG
jgi:alpha-ribazole phosphatase